jgi:signal transduction histidine kinase/ActR/RegA family two-component response regulator
VPAKRSSTRARIPYVVLLLTLCLTVAGTYLLLSAIRARDELRFQTLARETRGLIEDRINTYLELLRAAAALFGASDEVSAAEFREFTSRLRIRERYPGIQGVGFAVRVPREDVADPGRDLSRLTLEDIRVWPPGNRREYTAIIFLEPRDDRNRRAMGYDMFTDPARREAMERARDSGNPAASGRVTLVQEGDDEDAQPGFLIYVPVYRNEASIDTIEKRRAALIGWVYSPFRVNDLFGGIQAIPRTGSVSFEVHDGAQPAAGTFLYAHHVPLPEIPYVPHAPLAASHTIYFAGHPWTIQFASAQYADGSTPIWLAPAAAGLGLLVSFALFALTFWQYRARVSAEGHAAQLRDSEDALRQSEARLRKVVVLEREARAKAQDADRAKDEFLATLSHELRTPLNAILGWVGMLRAGKVRDDRRSGALDVIERNARTQARLVEDLLDVSRIITGKVRLEVQPLQMGPIVSTVVEALRPGAESRKVHVHTRIDPTDRYVMADAARLQQIVWNLLSNAIKFTPADGHVYVNMVASLDELELTVRDTGMGIAPDFLPHVFERFRQADSSTTRTHSGVGLGLSIARHLVELHGGEISAESAGVGAGATFIVRLPLVARVGVGGVVDDLSPVDLHGMRVLVVDDDEDARNLLEGSLVASRAEVTTAESAEEALKLLQKMSLEVMVSDIGMPEMDGYELIRRIRALPGPAGRIPAIALTAYVHPDDRTRALDAGYQIHMPKPVDLIALHAALDRLRTAPTMQ